MDIGKSISFITEDERWLTKIGIGAVLIVVCSLFFWVLLIPVILLGILLSGYTVQTARNVMNGVERPLPEWDNWGQLFNDGFAVFVAGLVYTLPIWLLTCCAFLAFIPAGAAGEGDLGEVLVAFGSLGVILISCLIFIFILALLVVYPAIIIQYVRTGELSATFRFGEVLAIARNNISNIIIALLVIMGVSFVISLIGAIPIIGWVVAIAGQIYLVAVQGHLYGQIGSMVDGPSAKEEKFAVE
jgi:hypothetical protein